MNQASGFFSSSKAEVSERFTEISEFSSGGFSILVRAKRFGQWWVLKALKPDVRNNPTYHSLLRKEYEILSHLQHSGIVYVEGMEQVDGYGDCIVMEWIDGDTLDEWLLASHPRVERRHIADQLLTVMEYVHGQQVVHRDLKPSNIMITRNGGTLKLIDFGLADADSYAILKEPAGTEGYVSPEQQEGGLPDVRNDIYSLGVILGELRLGWSYRKVFKRCLCPMSERYPHVASLRQHIRSCHRRLLATVCLVLLALLATCGAIIYNKVKKPPTMYDVVTEFQIGNLLYKSWGGGLVTVSAANDKDSCIEIPNTVSYQGVSYKVDEVEDSAFAQKCQLVRVVLPDNPRLHMMKRIFVGSPNLKSITFRSKMPPELGNGIWHVTIAQAFEPQAFEHVILYVPKGSMEAYRRSSWGRFSYIEEYE